MTWTGSRGGELYTREGVFIDGRWRAASSRETYCVVDPHSELPFGRASIGSAADVEAAVASARRALAGEWAQMPLEERIAIVLRVGELLRERRDEIAILNTRSMGGIHRYGLMLGGADELLQMYVEAIRRVDLEYLRSDAFGQAVVTRKPVGVVAGIVPWNAPVRSELKKIVPALLCGCTVVVKPAPETPFAAAILAELFTEAGAPPGVVNLVPGRDAAGEALVAHRDVRAIAFTGSSATGARISSVASPLFKRLQLELGGKSAAILLPDIDVESAMPTLVMSAWANSGQGCSLNTRILAPRSRYGEVLDAFVEAASAEVVGDPMDPATTMGPLVSRSQWDRVMSYIEIGKAEGARLAAGGRRPDRPETGYYVLPTVFADVDNAMRVAQEEIFGPVVSIIPYDSEDEAVALANDSVYGLAGSVFGTDEEHALAIARRVDSGCIAVNGFLPPVTVPFGGVKASGIGREHGIEGFESFLEYASYKIPPGLGASLARTLPAR